MARMKASTSEPSIRRRDPAIVLIADHIDERRTLHVETLLFLSDYRIVEAADARGVIERGRRLRPRVLVMPVTLPGMEPGSGAIGMLKEDPALRDMRVILIAERDDARGDKLAGDLNAEVLIHEPCLPSEIVAHVRRTVSARPDSGTHATRADRKRPSERTRSARPRDPRDGRDAREPRERDPKVVV